MPSSTADPSLYHPSFPPSWKRAPLYSLAGWVNGLAFRDLQFSEHGKPVIKIAEIKNGISARTKFTTQSFDDSVRIRSGDMLFSWSGQPETSIDVHRWRGPEGWLNQHVFRVTPGKECDWTFFFYLLRYLRPTFVRIARNKQTTGLGHVTRADLERLQVAYPSPAEQRGIASVVAALDDKIELNREMSATLEDMARALFKSWFVDFDPVRAKAEGSRLNLPIQIAAVFPDSFEESALGKIPTGWRAGRVDDDFQITMGQSPPGDTYNRVGPGVPFYQGCSDFTHRFPTRRVFCTAPTRTANPGDTLVSVRAPVGDVNMASEACAIGRGVAAVLHKSGSRSYTYYLMQSLREVFDRFDAEGTVFGSIGKNDFLAIPCIIPRSDALEAFEGLGAALDGRIEVCQRESSVLSSLRDTLLPKLISGEIRVRDAERVVEQAV